MSSAGPGRCWPRGLDVGGEDADWARYDLASMCFQEGADEDARAHLRILEQRDDAAGVGPAGLVAELLEARGEYEAALVWFDRALARTRNGSRRRSRGGTRRR